MQHKLVANIGGIGGGPNPRITLVSADVLAAVFQVVKSVMAHKLSHNFGVVNTCSDIPRIRESFRKLFCAIITKFLRKQTVMQHDQNHSFAEEF